MSNEGNIEASILLILPKCTIVGYSNGNKSLTGKLFSNYGPLNMPFHFFRYLIYNVFLKTFSQEFMKKLSFFSSNFKNPFQDVAYYRKLGCPTLWYWNGGLWIEGKKLKNLSVFGAAFSEIKKCWHFEFHESNISVMISHFS